MIKRTNSLKTLLDLKNKTAFSTNDNKKLWNINVELQENYCFIPYFIYDERNAIWFFSYQNKKILLNSLHQYKMLIQLLLHKINCLTWKEEK